MKRTYEGNPVLIGALLALVILAVFMQVGNHQFLSFDDYDYVTNNPHVASGMTGSNIIRAFTAVDAANWHPLTWLSHMADAQLYGLNPRGHHLTSVIIHTLSSLLLLLLLFRSTGSLWCSSLVAALFALHPLHVESVAWVAERKDVLSTFFWFLTLIFYCEYVVKQKKWLYISALVLYALGLMAKPMLVTLPAVLILVDFWPLGRYQGEGQSHLSGTVAALIKEKIPFFACSLLSSLITIYAQNRGGAIKSFDTFPLWIRIENSLVAYVKYIGSTLWPHDLAIYYPFPASIPLWQTIGALLMLLLISAAALRFGRRYPYLPVGWFWFIVTLVPVIGLVQVGGQAMADRYSYIPVTGLFIIAAWGAADLTQGVRYREAICALLAATVLIAATALTWHQLGYWRDNISLYRHTLAVTTDNHVINYNLGLALAGTGDLDAAIVEFRTALRIRPNYADARINLGTALAIKGELDAAIREFQEALRIKPNDAEARTNLGIALAQKRKREGVRE